MLTWGRSSVRDMTMRMGIWPPSRRVVSRGLSLRTVSPPTTTASERARVSKTCTAQDICRPVACRSQATTLVGYTSKRGYALPVGAHGLHLKPEDLLHPL